MTNSHLLFVLVYTAAWLVFAWGTFAFVVLRNRARAKRNVTTGAVTHSPVVVGEASATLARPEAVATQPVDGRKADK